MCGHREAMFLRGFSRLPSDGPNAPPVKVTDVPKRDTTCASTTIGRDGFPAGPRFQLCIIVKEQHIMQTNEIPWKKITTNLAVFGLVLGAVKILSPESVSKVSGVPQRKKLFRLFGAREIAAAIAILATRRVGAGL